MDLAIVDGDERMMRTHDTHYSIIGIEHRALSIENLLDIDGCLLYEE